MNETFTLRLTSNTSTVTLEPSETEITIIDDDGRSARIMVIYLYALAVCMFHLSMKYLWFLMMYTRLNKELYTCLLTLISPPLSPLSPPSILPVATFSLPPAPLSLFDTPLPSLHSFPYPYSCFPFPPSLPPSLLPILPPFLSFFLHHSLAIYLPTFSHSIPLLPSILIMSVNSIASNTYSYVLSEAPNCVQKIFYPQIFPNYGIQISIILYSVGCVSRSMVLGLK